MENDRTAMPAPPRSRRAAASSRFSAARAVLTALAALLAASPSLRAEAAALAAAADNRPIAITAQSGIEWQKAAQIYVARGNAVATRGTTRVHADTLTAHYRNAKGAEGGSEVYRLDADGHVVIDNGVDSVVGDQAVYDVGQQIAVITGKGLKLTTPTDVVTARDSLEWYDAQQIAVARGDAIAVRGDRRIRADVLTARLIKQQSAPETKPAGATKPAPAAAKAGAMPDPAEAENAKISRVDAQGHVVVSTPTDIGRADYGVYDAIKGIVTLIDNVTITRGPNVIRGQYAVVDLNTNISRMMTLAAAPGKPQARVEGIFVRQNTKTGETGSQPGRGNAPSGAKKP